MLTPNDFGAIGFGGSLRPSQVASSSIIKQKLDAGERRLLVVAPQGLERPSSDSTSGATLCASQRWS